jgi:hypothetical protein
MKKRYLIKGKTVLDRKTDLTWQREYATSKTWPEAMALPEELNAKKLGGYTDWRLPSVAELFGLVNHNEHGTASDFPGMPSWVFWSSSSYTYYASFAWGVNFNFGHVNHYGKSSTAYVRCVRGGA